MSSYLLPLLAIIIAAIALGALRHRRNKRASATCTACSIEWTAAAPRSTIVVDDGRDGEKYWRNYYGGRDD